MDTERPAELPTPSPDPVPFDLPSVPENVELSYDPKGLILTAHDSIARQAAELIKAGVQVPEVESRLQISLTGPGADLEVKERLEGILKYELPADLRRRLVRARMNSIVATGSDADAVKAAKIVADDPEVNISQQPAGVNLEIKFSEETLQLFEKVQRGDDKA